MTTPFSTVHAPRPMTARTLRRTHHRTHRRSARPQVTRIDVPAHLVEVAAATALNKGPCPHAEISITTSHGVLVITGAVPELRLLLHRAEHALEHPTAQDTP